MGVDLRPSHFQSQPSGIVYFQPSSVFIGRVFSSGTPLFEGARLLPPLEVEDFEDDQSHFLSATVLSRAMTDVSFQIRIWNYDRSQYYVE